MTTIETFEHIIRRQKPAQLVPFLLQLPKNEVVAVRKKTRQLQRELEQFRDLGGGSWGRTSTPEQLLMLLLAGLRTYSRKEALSASFRIWELQPKDMPYFWAVLEHTRPDWLADFYALRADRNSWDRPSYALLRELENRQLLAHQPRLFAHALPGLVSELGTELSRLTPVPANATAAMAARLAADPVLLARDLPLLFDYDTFVDGQQGHVQPPMTQKDQLNALGQYAWQHWETRHPRQIVTWLDVLLELERTGHLQRADLLSRCLLALRRDFRRPLLTWFKNLFLGLQPTLAERLARQADLVDLLAHPLPLVVNFALDQLKDLWAHSDFASAPPLLYAESLLTRHDVKTGIRTLFGGLEKLLKREAGVAPTLAALASTALAHADAAVQERAAKLLKTLLSAPKPLLTAAEAADTIAGLCLYADLLAPAARALLLPYLPLEDDDSSFSDAVSYVPQTGFVADISAATAIAPVRDWHELLFLTGQLVQQRQPAEVERWLDGLLRLRGQFPADYARQLHPYLVQALPWVLQGKLEDETRAALLTFSFGNHNGQQELLLALLMSWYLGFPHLKVPQVSLSSAQYHHPDPLLRVEQQRLAAVEEALWAFAAPLPLLSTPTHSPHWVAPSVLVQKLLDYEAAGQEPNSADLCLALARTALSAPDDAATARNLLPRFRNADLRQLLTSFLGPPTPEVALPTTLPKPPQRRFSGRLAQLIPFLRNTAAPAASPDCTATLPWLWAVAARTRQPHAPLPALQHCATYPGVDMPWQPTWKIQQNSHTYKQTWNKEKPVVTEYWQELVVEVPTPQHKLPSGLLLYSLHASVAARNNYSLWATATDLPFLLTLLPNHPEPLYWHLIRIGCRTADKDTSSQDALRVVLHSLLQPGPAFTEAATLLLALSLTHAAPNCRAVALEVLLAAVDNGRLVPGALGTVLGQLLDTGFAPVQRLTDALAQARAISALVDDALRQLLDSLLPLLPAAPLRNTRKLIEAYADLQGRTRQAVPEAVQQNLRAWSSSATLKKATAGLLSA
ncbi:DUF6493 family protein [Hymenobacter yonginensis]|uniref:DUF6493 family protein n=1 Tax=Hymenobacter yonginensis TaxID=748197 RepID=A0ABY7PPC4_9BACT|nr:DUF6493 family protein [Hymenobacter yonginensis]WBO84837.1 DUF6493 family protein [Hymenobacter yonginensis]